MEESNASAWSRIRPFVPDQMMPFGRRAYWLARGRYPRSLAQLSLLISSRSPRTFTDKVRYKMTHDRSRMLGLFADKYRVRDYVEGRIGPWVLPGLYGVHHSGRELLRDGLPSNFVLKPNHGSSAAVICWAGNPGTARIHKPVESIGWEYFLVHPDNLQPDVLAALGDKWLGLDYSYVMGLLPEFAYRDIRPRLLVEEVLTDADGRLPQDYKFFMFDGACKLVQVDGSRFGRHTRDLFTPTWEPVPARYVYPPSPVPPPKPEGLEEMLNIAIALSKGVDFVRADLYQTGAGIKFGELTNYPTGGLARLEPESVDRWLGADWHPRYGPSARPSAGQAAEGGLPPSVPSSVAARIRRSV